MEEKVCELKEEKTINDFLKENTEIISNIKYIAYGIKSEILGSDNEVGCDNCSPTCMLHALENQNCDLRKIISDLECVKKTITAK